MPSFSYQLYSSRNFPPLDITLEMLSNLGYAGVESYGALLQDIDDPVATRALLDQNNLVMKSSHVGLDFIKDDPKSVIALCNALGITNVYGPYLQAEDRPTTSAGWVEFAKSLTELSKPLRDAGLGFGWHNHDFEFTALEDGGLPMEIMLDEADALEMEFDVAWAVRADYDPIEFIKKYTSRITAAHVKDIAPEGECVDEDGWADVGHGVIDWPSIFGELQSVGTGLFVMEHDNPSDHHRFAKRSIENCLKFQITVRINLMKKLGVGIIGCGNVSAHYMRYGNTFNGTEVIACADINPEAAKARAEEFNLRADTIEDLLAADDIDIIINLTIPAAHLEVSQSILNAGKHVYSEKPYVLSTEEGDTLKKLATEKGLRIGSAPDTFLGGSHQHARYLIDTNTIGKVTSGTAIIMGHGMEHWHPNPDFFYQPGAGPVLDIGPYYISNLVQLLGPVEKISAMTSTPSKTRTISNGPRNGETIPVDTPTTIHALLQFKSGAIITVICSWDVWNHDHNHMELYGEDGTMYLPDPNFFAGDLKITSGSEAVDLPSWEHPFSVPNFKNDNSEGQMLANYRGAGLSDMSLAIQEGREHRCSMEFAHHVVDIMTSILKAGETGQSVKLTTTCERPAALDATSAQNLLA